MDKNTEKVIRPPVEHIASGTIFKPSKAYLRKMQLQIVILFLVFWICTILCFLLGAYIAQMDPGSPTAAQIISDYIWPVNLWTLVGNLIWFIPAIVLTPPYFNSIEYSVKTASGNSMPEIYQKEGIITITRRHVPFRTITNISSKAGPFDLFNIGSVLIETAGNSAPQKSPEITLHGIVFYEEVRDFILKELRRFKEPYTVGTELVTPATESTPKVADDGEMLDTLREIRDLLKAKQ